MDWQQILVTALSSGVIVKLLDFALSGFRETRERKAEKIKQVEEYLDRLTDLVQLFVFYAHSEYELRTEDENMPITPIRDLWGRHADISAHGMEPEMRAEAAFKMMQGVDLQNAIDQKKMSIVLRSENVLDLIDEIDPSQDLRKKVLQLYWLTTDTLASKMMDENPASFLETRCQITELRGEIHVMLQGYLHAFRIPRLQTPHFRKVK